MASVSTGKASWIDARDPVCGPDLNRTKANAMKIHTLGAACLIGAAVLATPTKDASANFLDVSAQVGYGFNGPDGTGSDINPYQLGVGARVDISFLAFLFIGANFMYYFGQDTDLTPIGLSAKENVGYTTVGGELGLSLDIGPVGIRPYVQAGALLGRPTDNQWIGENSNNSFFVAPGAAIVYQAGIFFIGPEARYIIATSNSLPNSLGLYGTVGFGF